MRWKKLGTVNLPIKQKAQPLHIKFDLILPETRPNRFWATGQSSGRSSTGEQKNVFDAMNAIRDVVGVTRALKQLNVSLVDDSTANGESANLEAAQETDHGVRSRSKAESGEKLAIEVPRINKLAGLAGEPPILHQSDSIRSARLPTKTLCW